MKKILFYLLLALFIFPKFAKCDEPLRRSLFVSVIQKPPVLSSRQEIRRLIDFAKKARVNLLFIQIYRANQAWFPSKVADSNPYEDCLKNTGEDAFALLIKEAHASGIQVHAWLNMLSLSQNKDAVILKKYGTGILTGNLKKKKKLEDYKIDDQYFLEPGDPQVQQELLSIVEEVLYAYPGLDGIQLDYIRYPDKSPAYGYTKINTERFKKTTGCKIIQEKSEIWKNWKRAQVTELLEQLVKKARTISPNIQVSTTGCAPYCRAYYEAFQDWPSWLKLHLVDFVTLMDYSPDTSEFERCILEAKNKTVDFKKVNIGIGAYKLVYSPEIFTRQFQLCKKIGSGSCAIFHYGSLLENPALAAFLIKTD